MLCVLKRVKSAITKLRPSESHYFLDRPKWSDLGWLRFLRLVLTCRPSPLFKPAMTNVRLSQSVRAFVSAAVIGFASPVLLASTPAASVVPASLDLRVADATGGAITD